MAGLNLFISNEEIGETSGTIPMVAELKIEVRETCPEVSEAQSRLFLFWKKFPRVWACLVH